MKSKTLQLMDPMDMGLVSNLDGMMRFVATLDMMSHESLQAADDKLEQLLLDAETPSELRFWRAAQRLIREHTDNATG